MHDISRNPAMPFAFIVFISFCQLGLTIARKMEQLNQENQKKPRKRNSPSYKAKRNEYSKKTRPRRKNEKKEREEKEKNEKMESERENEVVEELNAAIEEQGGIQEEGHVIIEENCVIGEGEVVYLDEMSDVVNDEMEINDPLLLNPFKIPFKPRFHPYKHDHYDPNVTFPPSPPVSYPHQVQSKGKQVRSTDRLLVEREDGVIEVETRKEMAMRGTVHGKHGGLSFPNVPPIIPLFSKNEVIFDPSFNWEQHIGKESPNSPEVTPPNSDGEEIEDD